MCDDRTLCKRSCQSYTSVLKREVHTTSTVLRVDFNYSDALGSLYRHVACGIASSGVVRFAATSLESVELVGGTLLERNSDHDAHLKRGVGYGETLL